ncbi:unnamed protein product, partial [Prorocentrum cordatum]
GSPPGRGRMELRVGGKFWLGRKIGSGSFGLLYESRLCKMILGGGGGVPNGNYSVMGPVPREDLFSFCNREFSLKTDPMLADQMNNRVAYVHRENYIHRDIKLDNSHMMKQVMLNIKMEPTIEDHLYSEYRGALKVTAVGYDAKESSGATNAIKKKNNDHMSHGNLAKSNSKNMQQAQNLETENKGYFIKHDWNTVTGIMGASHGVYLAETGNEVIALLESKGTEVMQAHYVLIPTNTPSARLKSAVMAYGIATRPMQIPVHEQISTKGQAKEVSRTRDGYVWAINVALEDDEPPLLQLKHEAPKAPAWTTELVNVIAVVSEFHNEAVLKAIHQQHREATDALAKLKDKDRDCANSEHGPKWERTITDVESDTLQCHDNDESDCEPT